MECGCDYTKKESVRIKTDFDKLYDFVAKNYPFIEIEER